MSTDTPQFDLNLPEPGADRDDTGSAGALSSADAMDSLLEKWQQQDWIRPLDLGFARLVRKLSEQQGESPPALLLLLAALVSHQVGRGHVCMDLAMLLHQPGATLALPPDDPGAVENSLEQPCPEPADVLAGVRTEDCLSALAASQSVSDGSLSAPMVLAGTRLYLYRFWHYEQQIAEGILGRLQQPSPLSEADSEASLTLKQALDLLFPPATEVDYQKLACALAARNRFSVITGGPGTGKTTTVVKLLAALQAIAPSQGLAAGQKYRIRLAAPTGKAAARLNESIGKAVGALTLEQLPGAVGPGDIPTRVTTLHRLLGSRPDSRRFRHHRDNPLPVDILVIDEASMVDVDLMASVFDALPDNAQLILLGDKDQLASVDAGAVLGELCQRATDGHYTPDTCAWLEAITGYRLPGHLQNPEGCALDQAVAMLRRSYRFGASSGIGQLAGAVNGNALTADLLQACAQGGFDDVIWLNGDNPRPQPEQAQALVCGHSLSGSPGAFPNQGREGTDSPGNPIAPPVGYGHYLELIRQHTLTADSPRQDWDRLAVQVLAAFSDFQILCALRRGPWGVEAVNDLVARHLQSAGLISRAEGWYSGRPVLVTGNDYNLGLMNGDIGIALSVPWGADTGDGPTQVLRVAFPSADNDTGIRWVSPSRLQQVETVFAMTVHKSQGSEFSHTCLLLPDRLSPVLTRELVYTGITRARNWFSLITGDARVLRQAVSQQVVRASGLAHQLFPD